jgi:hypothetical protein
MDVHEIGLCEPVHGWYWDGRECRVLSGCECGGTDCDRLFAGPDECAAAYASCIPDCSPQDAMGVGLCRLLLGWAWDGRRCVALGGCECEGEDCDELFDSPEECIAAYERCPSPCAPMRAEPVGPCDAILGVRWNGIGCEYISGCSCEGPECGELFDAIEDCEVAYRDCR